LYPIIRLRNYCSILHQNGNVKVEIFLHDENIWVTQAKIAELFDVDRTVVTNHLKNIFQTNELQESSACAKIALTASDGERYFN
jgi:hypothetical protein